MNTEQVENQIRRSSRIEALVALVSCLALGLTWFWADGRATVGYVGAVVWAFYALLYACQVGPGRSWLGAFLPGLVAAFFIFWAKV